MSILSIKNELYSARDAHQAVLLVDVFDIPSIEGAMAAFESRGSAGIIAVYGGWMEGQNAEALVRYLRLRIEQSNARLSMMLDHGSSVDQCKQAIDWGFSDVMFDGSKLPFSENVASTSEVVAYAKKAGVGAEAELGHVGLGKDYQDYGGKRKGFTVPQQAGEFVKETGVDFLAVAVGTAHGLYDGDPYVDIDLLAQIRKYVGIPLVLHGGTGLSREQFQSAIRAGITKINVASDMFAAAGKRVAEFANAGETSYFRFQSIAKDAFQERCENYIDIFRSA